MGSSVMGVSVMKNMMKKAMIYKNVEHVSVAEIPEKADLIVTTKSLEGRVRDVIKKYNKDIQEFMARIMPMKESLSNTEKKR